MYAFCFCRNYIRNLFLHTKEHILHFNFRRKKRQAEGFPGSGKGPKHDKKPDKPLRVRKEIRMMSDDERYLFFDAINSMKNNKVMMIIIIILLLIIIVIVGIIILIIMMIMIVLMNERHVIDTGKTEIKYFHDYPVV